MSAKRPGYHPICFREYMNGAKGTLPDKIVAVLLYGQHSISLVNLTFSRWRVIVHCGPDVSCIQSNFPVELH